MSNESKSPSDVIISRILSRLGGSDILDRLLSLQKSDFNSFMLNVYKKQADSMTPIDIVKAFQTNRFTIPSEIDPVLPVIKKVGFKEFGRRKDAVYKYGEYIDLLYMEILDTDFI